MLNSLFGFSLEVIFNGTGSLCMSTVIFHCISEIPLTLFRSKKLL